MVQKSANSGDGSLAAMVRLGISKAREKLIDLTLRNGMLNYRHSETSTRHVRLVDEKLPFLTAVLANGKSLEIAPLPPVELIPRDEDTEEFRVAIKSAKTNDPEWLAAEDARRATGGKRMFRDKAAERSLRDRVRATLGMPPWKSTVDPKARAKELGIDPSYDLPRPEQADADRHTDNRLQTLFFPDKLEAKLSTIHATAKTLQEDAGISALYCALGFLEWYDADDATNPAYAPLVLLPINMERQVASGEYVFSIKGRDEDETTNAALREKLRRHHALELPEYDPDMGVEEYFKAVAEVIKSKTRWRIRRWATIGLFSFARQSMWGDLDPEKWPHYSRPETHQLLQEIYGDVAATTSDSVAQVYDVDRPEFESKAPAVVSDCDASQLSAVIDVANGRNLVVQGPPGTGKSQAITNIIANAMCEGKSILFVSEKMAALKVVKDRLDVMGLGLYCLEVHSTKASKTQVLASIKERMQAARPHMNSADLENAVKNLKETRQRLTEYAALMNQPAGSTGLTTHEVLWGDFCRGNRPDNVPPAAFDFRLDDPLQIDRFKLAELKGAAKALDDLSASLGNAADPANQTWRGVSNLNLSRFDRPRALEVVQEWGFALSSLRKIASGLEHDCQWSSLATLKAIDTATVLILQIAEPSDTVQEQILPLTLEKACEVALANWSKDAIAAHELAAEIEKIGPAQAVESHVAALPEIIRQAENLIVMGTPVEEFAALRDAARDQAQEAEGNFAIVQRVFNLMGRDATEPVTAKSEAMVGAVLRISRELPAQLYRFRNPTLLGDGAAQELEASKKIAQQAQDAQIKAGFAQSRIDEGVDGLPSAREFREAAGIISSTSFLGRIFSSKWREAATTWRKAFPAEKLTSYGDAANRLAAAGEWRSLNANLDNQLLARDAAGRFWAGMKTPFSELVTVATWMKSIREATPINEKGSQQLRKLLHEGNQDDLAEILEVADAANQSTLFDQLKQFAPGRLSIKAVVTHQRERVIAFDEILQAAQDLQLQRGVKPHDLKRALHSVTRLQQLRKEMNAEPLASNAAATVAGLNDADRAVKIKATLEYAQQVSSIGLPSACLENLLRNGYRTRLKALLRQCERLADAAQAEQASRKAADALLELNPDEWCGAPFESADLEKLERRVRKAADNPDDLDKQLRLLSSETEAEALGLRTLLAAWVDAGLRYEGVAAAIDALYFRSAAESLMRDNPVLARHTGKVHDQVRDRFRSLDKEILRLNRQMIAATLHSRPIPPGARAQSTKDYTDNQMLDHQSSLQRPRIALRRLFSNAGNAIRAYKPCVMMSPMSVSQYLEPGKHLFDLLVIDEASQMRPEDSLGALLRVQQAVIVGDPEQLPPSDFFMAAEHEDAQEAEDSPEESILELGRRCWHPMRMLEVHYRSKHQSLIAYSNQEFYQERLLVYPSPVLDDPDFGVTCHRVDGNYEAGQGRNMGEAVAIVAEAARLMKLRLDRSIGIVAVNQAQSDLIEKLINELKVTDLDVQAYMQEWDGELEEFFVKNLENVQGDERDIILISTVYGRTAEGIFHQNFGPINKAYGHRRLNVLFTRAKRKLTVFTSLDHTQIVADGKQRGVRVLKEFLEYASSGTYTPGRKLDLEPDSDFERWFLSRLSDAGYEAHPQVGVAKYRIDIGVVHPDKPGSYILGVECDGATYHSSKAARDRDRLRQDVLEGLNWKIHRVWSTDWYRDPEREFARLKQQIENLRTV